MRKLFGTDGVRGSANQYPMTGDVAFRLGQAAAQKFRNGSMKVIIGKDTRRSGYIFEYALTAGLCSMGANVYLMGPMPTPAVGHLVRSFAADLGIVITASHNPAGDNGIKFFDSRGRKLADETELEIEELFFKDDAEYPRIEKVGRAYRIDDAAGRYIEYAKGSISNMGLDGLRIVLDCAHGAAYKVAPLILGELGAEVSTIGTRPDGLNINRDCGATYLDTLQKEVVANKAHVGIALDGDADRVIMVDEKGSVVDGDQIMGMCAAHMKKKGILKQDVVVATVMSNMGLESELSKHNIRMVRTKVGDTYVIEEMMKNGYNIGGEQSGHIIFSDYNTTGDGMVAALQVLRILKESGRRLSRLRFFEPFPQALVNVPVREKKPLEKMPKVLKTVTAVESAMKGEGRVLVRYSGTENKCRVMVEGRGDVQAGADRIAKAIEAENS